MRLYPNPIRRSLTMAALVAGILAAAPLAYAGSCPASAMRPDGTGQAKNATPGKGGTDTVLSSIDLAKEPANVPGRLLRLRKLVIEPGGVVPWHEHATAHWWKNTGTETVVLLSADLFPAADANQHMM